MPKSSNETPAWVPMIGCIVVHALGMLLTVLLHVAVVPSFVAMFADMGMELPAPTQLVIDCSKLLCTFW